MNRRRFLFSASGVLAALAGGVAVGEPTRADIWYEEDLHRGRGAEATIERTITEPSESYIEESHEVTTRGSTLSFDTWGHRKCFTVASRKGPSIVDERLDTDVVGLGSSVRGLLYDFVAVIHHSIHLARDGSVISEPNVGLDEVISVAPRTITVTVSLDGQDYTESVPVAVEDSVSQNL